MSTIETVNTLTGSKGSTFIKSINSLPLRDDNSIHELSVNGKTITITKGDGATDTIVTDVSLEGHTHNTFVKSGTGAAAGFVPAPSTTAGTTKYLREDGTWQVPPDNNTVTTATTSGSGNAVTAISASNGALTVTKGSTFLTAHQTNKDLGQGYGTCGTAAATVDKVGTLSGYVLTLGGLVSLRFTYAVPAAATLNINSKGAKPIYYKNAAITEGVINAGDTVTFIYDGTNYRVVSIDKCKNVDLGIGYGTCSTGATTTAKAVAMTGFKLVVGAVVSVTFTNKVNANQTLNVASTGAKPIFHRGAAIEAGIINAGDTATFMYDGTNWNIVGMSKIKIKELTQSEYDAISTKDADTYYFIKA